MTNIIYYFEMILTRTVGIGFPIWSDVGDYYSKITEFGQIFNPPYLLSGIVHLACAFGIFQITCVFPFRLLKKLIGYPSRKGSEK